MRRNISLLLVAFSITVLLAIAVPTGRALSEPHPSEPASNEAAFAPGRILVKVKDSAPPDALASVNRKNGAHVEEKIPDLRVSVVDLPKGLPVAEAIDTYEASAAVEYAEPDYALKAAGSVPAPNDPSFPKMYDMDNRGQYGGTVDADLDAPEAWSATTGSSGTVVAVIDTGVDIRHPDLNDNIWTNPGESGVDPVTGEDRATNGEDDDNNGYIDDVHGWDFFNDDASVFDPRQGDVHGTHVAGTIAAEGNNDRGVTGVSWHAKIMPLKFIGPGDTGYVSDAAAALDYAVSKGVKISNNSYGYWDTCNGCYAQTLRDAIARADRADHLFVAAAMNGGSDFVGDDTDTNPMYPSSYDNPNIISVAASNNKDELTSFSNYGVRTVDLAAPGKDILSTWPGNRYRYGLGTSMATPHVAGVAALIKSQSPQLSDTQIKDRILANVDKKPGLQGKLVTGGRLNAAKALGANTAPVIDGVSPRGRASVRPTISSRVWDDETLTLDPAQGQIQLYIDGNQKLDFSYDQATDTLTYVSGKLANRRHNIKIVVVDGQGLQEVRTWSFWAGRRR